MSLNDYIAQRRKEEQDSLVRKMEDDEGLKAIVTQYHYNHKPEVNSLETRAHKFLSLYLETGEIEEELVTNYEMALEQFKKAKIKIKSEVSINYDMKNAIAFAGLASLGGLGIVLGRIGAELFPLMYNVPYFLLVGMGAISFATGALVTLDTFLDYNPKIERKTANVTLKIDLLEYITNLKQLDLYTRELQEKTRDLHLVDPIQAEYLEKKYGLEGLEKKMQTAQEELQKTARITGTLLFVTNTSELPLERTQETRRIAEELDATKPKTSQNTLKIIRRTSRQEETQ